MTSTRLQEAFDNLGRAMVQQSLQTAIDSRYLNEADPDGSVPVSAWKDAFEVNLASETVTALAMDNFFRVVNEEFGTDLEVWSDDQRAHLQSKVDGFTAKAAAMLLLDALADGDVDVTVVEI